MENSQIHQLTAEQARAVQVSFMNRVYAWMFGALMITGFVALRAVSSESLMGALFGGGSMMPLLVLFAVELGLVWWLSASIDKISASLATGLFVLYSALNGLTISMIFLVYTKASIASTFFITAATFGVMSLYGYVTKKDLSSWGNLLFMALIGFLIASVVNIFLRSEFIYWLVTYAGILIFVGLTAYDTQKIKRMSLGLDSESEAGKKGAIMGALMLYLDFINLFLLLLRVLGDRR